MLTGDRASDLLRLRPSDPTPQSRKLRIHLLCPRGPLYRHRGGSWKKTMRYAPLTLTTLASLVPSEIAAEVRITDEGVDEIDPGRIEADRSVSPRLRERRLGPTK